MIESMDMIPNRRSFKLFYISENIEALSVYNVKGY
jgi:hypothetical protein